MPQKLVPSDIVYRVIDPEHGDDRGPLAIAFEDPGKPYAGQSFFVARIARPVDALNALAGYSRAKKICGVRGRPATPGEMYLNGYRVAAISAEVILKAIDMTRVQTHPLSIIGLADEDYATDGHIDLRNAKFHGASLARASTILSEAETLPG